MLAAIFYYLIILPVSKLPFWVLYRISDTLFLVLYYIFGYRKVVILENIRNSFPEMSLAEHRRLTRKYYRHLCDLIVESLKIFTIAEKEIHKRMVIANPEFLSKYFEQKQSLILAGGHMNNWELFAVAIAAAIKHQAIGIYQPLTNRFFDAKMKGTRSKYGLKMISTKIVKEVFEAQKDIPTITIFGADQSPSKKSKCHTMMFLNQKTRVAFGTEKYAKEYNYPVVYGRINKRKRGFYTFEFLEVIENPQTQPHGAITEKITSLLEQDIRQDPEFWLWSHKRWKHKSLTPQLDCS
jgi:Kdo2-lipid IVA lauroyltransferase/acyltransferase